MLFTFKVLLWSFLCNHIDTFSCASRYYISPEDPDAGPSVTDWSIERWENVKKPIVIQLAMMTMWTCSGEQHQKQGVPMKQPAYIQVSLCLFFACVCLVLSQDYPSTRVGLHDSGDHHVFPNPELALSKVGTGAMATKLQHTESAKYSFLNCYNCA